MTLSYPSYREIRLSKGFVAKVDWEDYPWLSQLRWHVQGDSSSTRVYATTEGPEINKVRIGGIRMHRLIMGLKKGDKRQVDHINRDTLDNRRENLRIVTQTQNSQNRNSGRGNKTGFKGVWKHKEGKYTSQIQFEGRKIHLGLHRTAENAYKAYCSAARDLFGEYACFK
jgi:hypothetical protein